MAPTEHSPALLLVIYLRGTGVIVKGSTGDQWSGFVSFMPDDDPDDAVGFFDVAGTIDGRSQIDGDYWEHPGIVCRVRSLDYSEGYKEIRDIVKKVDEIKRNTVSHKGKTYTISSVKRTGPVLSLGIEPDREPERNLFSVNFLMTVS